MFVPTRNMPLVSQEAPVAPGECVVMVGFNHASAGKHAVALTKLLCSAGIKTFCTDVWCPRGRAGTDWQTDTCEGVETCKYFVALMTKGWQESNECQSETKNVWARVRHKKATIIPVVFPDFDKVYDKKNKQFWTQQFVSIQQVNAESSDWMDQVKDSINVEKVTADVAKVCIGPSDEISMLVGVEYPYGSALDQGVKEGKWKSPFFVLYRSNLPGSSAFGLTSGLFICSQNDSYLKYDKLDDAISKFESSNRTTHGYCVCDRNGKVVFYHAKFTSSMTDANCAACLKQWTNGVYGK